MKSYASLTKAQKQQLRSSQKQLAAFRRHLKRLQADQRRGMAINRREMKRLREQQLRAMMKMERTFGLYVPKAKKLTAARRRRIRQTWPKAQRLFAGQLFRVKKRRKKRRTRRGGTFQSVWKMIRKKRKRALAQSAKRRKKIPRSNRRTAPKYSRRQRPNSISDHQLQVALRSLQRGKSLAGAAKEIGVSPPTLKRRLDSADAIQKRGRRWVVRAGLSRRMLLFTDRGAVIVNLPNQDEASEAGRFMAAVGRFLFGNDATEIESFRGKFVRDVRGRKWVFLTDPEEIYRLASTGFEVFEDVYRVVI